jgi:hypothetical protein
MAIAKSSYPRLQQVSLSAAHSRLVSLVRAFKLEINRLEVLISWGDRCYYGEAKHGQISVVTDVNAP